MFGVTIGFHRLLTHRGFSCPKWFEHSLAILGMCNLQDSPARWVAIHRLHHRHSDQQADPHSPLVNFFWGHVGWVVCRHKELDRTFHYARYVPDLLRDPFYLRLERRGRWFFVFLAHAIAIIKRRRRAWVLRRWRQRSGSLRGKLGRVGCRRSHRFRASWNVVSQLAGTSVRLSKLRKPVMRAPTIGWSPLSRTEKVGTTIHHAQPSAISRAWTSLAGNSTCRGGSSECYLRVVGLARDVAATKTEMTSAKHS